MPASVYHKNPLALLLLQKRLNSAAKKVVAVGFPAGKAQAYPEGQEVAEIAAKHVYGIEVPKRDFMGYSKQDIQERTRPILRKAAKIAATGNVESSDIRKVEALLAAAGLAAESAIKAGIVALDQPPNAASTIAAKGSSNPLIDTGHMRDSVTSEVRKR
jgi:hypothetical protein